MFLLAVCVFLCGCAPGGTNPVKQSEADRGTEGRDIEIVSDQEEEGREDSEKISPKEKDTGNERSEETAAGREEEFGKADPSAPSSPGASEKKSGKEAEGDISEKNRYLHMVDKNHVFKPN